MNNHIWIYIIIIFNKQIIDERGNELSCKYLGSLVIVILISVIKCLVLTVSIVIPCPVIFLTSVQSSTIVLIISQSII